MTIEYKTKKTGVIKGLGYVLLLGLIVAIPAAVVWGMIYATTLFIGTLFGG